MLPLAVVGVDAVMWRGARPEVLDWLDQLVGEPAFDQLLARALTYRLVTKIVRRAGTDSLEAAGRTGEPVTELILTRLAR